MRLLVSSPGPVSGRDARVPALIGAAALTAAYIGWLLAGPAGLVACPAALGLTLAAPIAARAARGPRAARPRPDALAAFAVAADDMGLGFATLDARGRVLACNAALGRLLGPVAPGARLADAVAPGARSALEHAIAGQAAAPSRAQDVRVEPLAGDGTPLVLTIGNSPAAGCLIALTKDDSLALKLEAQMRQAAKMQALGQLAGGIAHDFNNVLTAIIGHCDLMLMRHRPGDIDHHDTEQVRQNANRAADLVRQLLAFARQQTLRMRTVRLPDVVGNTGHLLQRLLGEAVRLEITGAPALAPVHIDPGQIEQVLVNLAVNARDAMPGGGTLSIATYALPAAGVAALGHSFMPQIDYVALAVGDTGHGIAPEIIANVFDPFFTTKEVGKGTGLGLAMVYGIVKQCGGFVFAQSEAGQGSRFTIYLPAVAAEPVAAAPPPAPALEGWGEGTILLVEDEAMVRAVAARALTRSGYTVVTAEGGEEALEIVEARDDIQLLISDVVMMGMDGPTLVARARARRPGLRAIYISGYAEEQVRARVDDPQTPLLRKPFSVQELSAAVRTRLAA